jgi:tetratricopeptide (TPR) repeat protein
LKRCSRGTPQGDYDVATRHYDEAIRSFHRLGDVKHEVESRVGLGRRLRETGDRTKASIQLNTARRLASKKKYHYGFARALSNLGIVAADKGRSDEAREFFQKSKEISENLSNDFLQGVALNNLGAVERNAGEFDRLTSHLSCIGKADVSWKGRAATKI